MFRAVSVQAKKAGKAETKHKLILTDPDILALGDYFDHDHTKCPDPRKLRECVLFYLMYFFCHRGQENLHEMTKDTFSLVTDYDGQQYVQQEVDEKDKNHGISDHEKANQARMYEDPGIVSAPT